MDHRSTEGSGVCHGESNRVASSQVFEPLLSLIAEQILRDSFGQQLSRMLQIAEKRAWFSQRPVEEDLGDVIRKLQRPGKSIIALASEYSARSSATFAPAFEKATTLRR